MNASWLIAGFARLLAAASFLTRALGADSILDDEISPDLDLNFRPAYGGENVAVQRDGKILVAGPHSADWVEWPGDFSPALVRLNPDGSLDPNFKANINDGAYDFRIALEENGNILLSGSFDQIDGVKRRWLARLLPNGRLDSTFVPAGDAFQGVDTPPGIAILRNGRHILLGQPQGLLALRNDGAMDQAFNENIASQPESFRLGARKVIEQFDGRLLCISDETLGDKVTAVLVRLNADGTHDKSFSSVMDVNDVLPLADGRIVISSSGGLMRLTAGGTVDASFVRDAIIGAAVISPVAELNGKLFATAIVWGDDGSRGFLYRLNADGLLDRAFVPVQFRRADTLNPGPRMRFAPHQGNLLCWGDFNSVNTLPAPGLARILIINGPTSAFAFTPAHFSVANPSSYRGRESDSAVEIRVLRLGNSSSTATVNFATRDGSARAGANYAQTKATLEFAPLELEKTIRVPLINNSVFQGAPEFFAVLSDPSDPKTGLSPPVRIPIFDDEVGIIPDSIRLSADGGIQFTMCVGSRRNYVLERSSDLKTWAQISFLVTFTDEEVFRAGAEVRPSGNGPWFYRVRRP